MIDIEIRDANKNDFHEIHSMNWQFSEFIITPEKFQINIEDKFNDYFNCIVAVNANRQIIGFATYFFSSYSWIGKALYLVDLFVLENYRRHKVGNQLIDKIIEIAKKSGCKKVRWQVSNWNKKAIDFYKKLGAEIDEGGD